MNQQSLFYSDTYAALREVVEAVGKKKVAGDLWPELSPDKAQQRLIDALNPNHRTQLDPMRLMQLLRMGQERGIHTAFDFICDHLDYKRTEPVNPEQQIAELQKDFLRAVEVLENITSEIQRKSESMPRKGPARAERIEANGERRVV